MQDMLGLSSPIGKSGAKTPEGFERLEYGKFTDGFGIAEMMEHDVLAKSSGFPDELLPFCGPRVVGPSLRDNDRLPDWAPHGTVFQPIKTHTGVAVLWARVLSLTEGRSSRSYQRARFIATGLGDSPLRVLNSLDSEPLTELARGSNSAAPPLPADFLPGVTTIQDEFLSLVLPYILAGCSIEVNGLIQEAEFFTLTQSIWEKLPSGARAGFSAGWGIGMSQRGRLTISAGVAVDQGSAVLEKDSLGTWQLSRPERFDGDLDERLKWARLFIRVLYNNDLSRPSPNTRHFEQLDHLLQSISLAEGVLRSDDAPVKQLFEHLGKASFDLYCVDQVIAFLENPEAGMPKTGVLFESLWFAASFDYCVAAVLPALENEDTVHGAVRLLEQWLLEGRERTQRAIRSATGPGSLSAKRLEGLLSQDSEAVLRELLDPQNCVVPWTTLETEAISIVLTRGLHHLESPRLKQHDHILALSVVPLPYVVFLRVSGWSLVLKADCIDRTQTSARIDQMRRLFDALPDRVRYLDALARFEFLPAPLPDTIDSIFSEQIAECVLARYEDLQTVPDTEKDAWLSWAYAFLPAEAVPFVDLMRRTTKGHAVRPSPEAIKRLSEDVRLGKVPPAAYPALSSTALNCLGDFLEQILQSPSQWWPIIRNWPPVCLEHLNLGEQVDRRLPSQLRQLNAYQLELLLTHWTTAEVEAERSNSYALSNLLRETRDIGLRDRADAPLAWLCGDLIAGRRSFMKMLDVATMDQPTLRAVAQIVQLFAIVGPQSRDRLLSFSAAAFWDMANSAASLLFVLLLFPEQQVLLTLERCALLSGIRGTLQKHRIAERQADPRFRLAASEFHALSYHSDREFYPGRQSPLWAAFHGVPFSLQGDLPASLQHFGSTPRERVLLCRQYVKASQDKEAAAKVVRDFFIRPVLQSTLGLTATTNFLKFAVQYFTPGSSRADGALDRKDNPAFLIRASAFNRSNFEIDEEFFRLIKEVLTIRSGASGRDS